MSKKKVDKCEPCVEKKYCGLSILPQTYDRYGTRFECMKKGVGVGMMVMNEKIQNNQPIPERKIKKNPKKKYCGTDLMLPDNYTQYGNRYECLKKGVGVGMNLELKKHQP
jgi:hypothetical protein